MNALAKKLQMKPGQNWLLYNAPEGYPALLEPLPGGLNLHFTPGNKADGVQVFVKNREELKAALQRVQPVLSDTSVLWVIYPKKSAKIPTDLAMTGEWQEAEQYGLTSVAAAAIDATWTALRFKPSSQVKVSATCNAELPATPYAGYIDTAARQVTLPPDVIAALQPHPAALDYLQSLSYSHKKEYVLWILTAKQEKTRQQRLAKMTGMLLQRKKNPADR
ncbi:YdeI/OmpD-associated family protein [Mucilaginibacter sp.]